MPVAVPARSPPRPSLPRSCKKPVVQASPGKTPAVTPEVRDKPVKATKGRSPQKKEKLKGGNARGKDASPAKGAKGFVASLTSGTHISTTDSSHRLAFAHQSGNAVDSITQSLQQLQLELRSPFTDNLALPIIAYLLMMNIDEQRVCADELARNGIKVYDYEYTVAANRARPQTAKRVRARIAEAEDIRRKIEEDDLWHRNYLDEQQKVKQGLMKRKDAKIRKPPPLKGKAKPLRRDETIVHIPLSATIGHTPIPPSEPTRLLHEDMTLNARAFAVKSCLRRAMVNAAQRRWWRVPDGIPFPPHVESMTPTDAGGMLGVMMCCFFFEVLWNTHRNAEDEDEMDGCSEAGTET
ncbi:unnamed protein product [Peniophora sp. CBMAI 1063]|nr:unnamed protein product [Peniophora sp. CBMAI 1063]